MRPALAARLARRHEEDGAVVDPAVDDVAGQAQVDRPRPPGQGVAECRADVLRDALRLGHQAGPLGDRFNHPDLVHLLERQAVTAAQLAVGADRDDRAAGEGGHR